MKAMVRSMTKQLFGVERLYRLGQQIKFQKTLSSHSSTLASAELSLSANKCMVTEQIEISLDGLDKDQGVTLQTFVRESGTPFSACGHYRADDHGRVSTQMHPSLEGTYTGIEPMGLFWSMASVPGEKPKRLLKSDVTRPYSMTVAVHEGFLSVKDLHWAGDFSNTLHSQLERHHMAEGVQRISVEEDGLYGTLFLPPGHGPFPGVIDLFGFNGGIQENRSPLLASMGIASFTPAYIGYKDLTKDGQDMDFHYFLRAFDWLCSHPMIDSNNMGCLASCLGGGYGMFLTSKRPNIRCYVSINGIGYPVGPPQKVEGEEIAVGDFDPSLIVVKEEAACFKKLSMQHGSSHLCPGWRHGAKMLFFIGEDDECMDPAYIDLVTAAVPTEFKDNVTVVAYPGAGHIIDPPFTPLCRSNYSKVFHMPMLWGGQPKPHADAQKDCWHRLTEFFKENLLTV